MLVSRPSYLSLVAKKSVAMCTVNETHIWMCFRSNVGHASLQIPVMDMRPQEVTNPSSLGAELACFRELIGSLGGGKSNV